MVTVVVTRGSAGVDIIDTYAEKLCGKSKTKYTYKGKCLSMTKVNAGTITKDGAKISKSRGNVVNPDEYIAAWGADTVRLYLMFMGPYMQGGDFSDRGIAGVRRFLGRVWHLVAGQAGALSEGPAPDARRRRLHQAIDAVTRAIDELSYNTAIAALMDYAGTIGRHERLHAEDCAECESGTRRVERIDRRIALHGPLDDAQRAKLMEIADKCPVHQTLTARLEIRTTPEAVAVT